MYLFWMDAVSWDTPLRHHRRYPSIAVFPTIMDPLLCSKWMPELRYSMPHQSLSRKKYFQSSMTGGDVLFNSENHWLAFLGFLLIRPVRLLNKTIFWVCEHRIKSVCMKTRNRKIARSLSVSDCQQSERRGSYQRRRGSSDKTSKKKSSITPNSIPVVVTTINGGVAQVRPTSELRPSNIDRWQRFSDPSR